jgi:hypothetical protein
MHAGSIHNNGDVKLNDERWQIVLQNNGLMFWDFRTKSLKHPKKSF